MVTKTCGYGFFGSFPVSKADGAGYRVLFSNQVRLAEGSS